MTETAGTRAPAAVSRESVTQAAILRWSEAHAMLMLLALLLQWHLKLPALLPFVAALSFSFYLFSQRAQLLALWGRIGRANLLSLLRFVLLGSVVLLYSRLAPPVSACLLLCALLLDGVDGALARRYAEAGSVGHYLDVEVDAFAIAALSVLLWHYHSLPGLLLLAAALRYGYVWLIKLTVRAQSLEPRRRYASIIAVSSYLVMVFRLLVDHPLADALLLLVCIVLLLSFSRSAWFQWRAQGRTR